MIRRQVVRNRAKVEIGAKRWRLEHISYKAWCALATKRGWKGKDGNDGLRDHAEPEEAALVRDYPSLDMAKAAALAIFAADPEDSAFGAILIERQTLEPAHDDRGTLVRGCPPEWETQQTWEITSDGDCLECGQ